MIPRATGDIHDYPLAIRALHLLSEAR